MASKVIKVSKRREWETKPLVEMIVDGVAYPGRTEGQTNALRREEILAGGQETIAQLTARGITNRRQWATERSLAYQEAEDLYYAEHPVEACYDCMQAKSNCTCPSP